MGLQAAFGLLAVGAAVLYWLRHGSGGHGGWTRTVVKTLSVAALAGVALTLPLGTYGLIALGLALGAAGDFWLSRPGAAAFLAGMGAFAAGHLAYTVGFLLRAAALGLTAPTGLQWAAAAGLIALIASTERWLAPQTGALRWPVRGYVLVIGAMGLATILLPSRFGADVLRLGAGLFILSDLLLALRLFVVTDPRLQDRLSMAPWPAYWCGQALILFGAVGYFQIKG